MSIHRTTERLAEANRRLANHLGVDLRAEAIAAQKERINLAARNYARAGGSQRATRLDELAEAADELGRLENEKG